jgi:hypothetical protein
MGAGEGEDEGVTGLFEYTGGICPLSGSRQAKKQSAGIFRNDSLKKRPCRIQFCPEKALFSHQKRIKTKAKRRANEVNRRAIERLTKPVDYGIPREYSVGKVQA